MTEPTDDGPQGPDDAGPRPGEGPAAPPDAAPPVPFTTPEAFQAMVRDAANVISMAQAMRDREAARKEEKRQRKRERAERKADRTALPGAEVRDPSQPPDDGGGGGGGGRGVDAERRRTCPLVPLGARDGTYFVMTPRGELRAVSFRHLRAQGIVSIFDGDPRWAYEHFPREIGADGSKIGLAEQAFAAWLMRECSRHGFLDFRDVRGGGVWPEADGGLVVHLGDEVLLIGEGGAVRRAPVGHRSDTAVYALADRQTRPAVGERDGVLWFQPAPASVAGELEAHLGSWAFDQPYGPRLWLGWIAQACLAGVLDWTPHIIVTGDSHAGKSSLQRLAARLLGQSLLGPLADPTEAGLRFSLRGGSRPVIVDEMENSEDNRRVLQVMDLATLASTRDQGFKLRGGDSGTTILYPVRGTFYLQAILHPPLSTANVTRFTVLSLSRPKPDAGTASRLSERERYFAGHAAGLRARMIVGYERFRQNLQVYLETLIAAGHRARAADQLGTLLAAADTLASDLPTDSVTARTFVDLLPPPVTIGAYDETADHWQCFNRLLSSMVERQVQTAMGGTVREKISVGEALSRVIKREGEPTTAHAALRRHGIAVHMVGEGEAALPCIVVANSHAQLAALFVGTKWAAGVWGQALIRLPGAWREDRVISFAGAKARGVWLPTELLAADEAATPAPPAGGADIGSEEPL